MAKLIGLIFLPVDCFTSRLMEIVRSYSKEKKIRCHSSVITKKIIDICRLLSQQFDF
jgi:hypothetical protein